MVCKVGGRSAQVTGYLLQQGRDAVNLDGGMLDWEAAGREMVSDTGQRPLVFWRFARARPGQAARGRSSSRSR